ncbi:hypothetical protein LR48_Vigan07g210800 [Vigna angularis]|uniref:DUF8039 domain-containing protein n=1 Tax=Phaseolus angularis TaxID=3914 RepID=A0A0L9V0X2_PHAAN|nr:hypothetical protein LR48_Vigan07g210800 [Vigna angularis]
MVLPTHERVMIDEVRDSHARVPVPTSEIQFVREALGTFIAWLKAMIMPYFGPPPFYHPDEQPMAKPVSHEDHEEVKDDYDPLTILMKKLHKLNKGPCNKQTNFWPCGYYIMSWMKTIIRAGIRAD